MILKLLEQYHPPRREVAPKKRVGEEISRHIRISCARPLSQANLKTLDALAIPALSKKHPTPLNILG